MNPDTVGISSNAPAFVIKLWKLVEDHNVNDLISWSKEGTAFCVHDPVAFARDVLPYYFKHSNFTSFVRQLNMYGFKKLVSTDHGGIKSDNPEWEFHHQYFVQGRGEWLENIKRKVHPDEKKIKSEDVSVILEDVKNLHAKHGAVQSQLQTIKMENEMLWQEVSDLRSKHRKQQHVLNKLIKFLILVYGRKGVSSRKRLAIESVQVPPKQSRMSPPHAQIEELENLRYHVESPKDSSSVLFPLESEESNTGPQITLLPDEPFVHSPQPSQTISTVPVVQTGTVLSVPTIETSATARSPLTTDNVPATQKVTVVHPSSTLQVIPFVQEIQSGKQGANVKKEPTASFSQGEKLHSTSAKSVNKPKSTKGAKKDSSNSTEKSLKLKMPTMVSLTKESTLDFSPSIFENIGQIFPSDTNVSNLVVDDTLQELASSYDQSNAVVLKRSKSSDKDLLDHDVDHINNSLESLQNLLSGGHYNIDPELLSQLFDPDVEKLPIDSKPVTGNMTVVNSQTKSDKGAGFIQMDDDDDNEADDMAPFSPGMFLNDVGEPSSEPAESELEAEEKSLLS